MVHRMRASVAIALVSILCIAEHRVGAYILQGQNNFYGPFSDNSRNSRSICHLAGGSTRLRHRGPKKLLRNTAPRLMRIPRDDSRHDAAKPIKAVGLEDDIPSIQSSPSLQSQSATRVVKESSDAKVDLLVSFAYFCTAFAITLPIILVPAIAYQEYQLPARALTTFCSTVASVAMIGAGSGKIINGIVCQKIGGVATASIYAAGMSICSLALSFSRSLDSVRWIVAGMEFFSSAMWVAFSVIFSNHYKKEPMKIARGVSYLSLASASGQLIAKIFGSALLQFTGWRNIAKLGALVSFLGSMIVRFGLAETDKLAEANNLAETNDLAETNNLAETNDLSLDTEKKDEGMVSKIRSVLSSKVFWMVGFAHLAGHIAKSSDRILGAFLIEITALPFQVCGALTTCVTLGFVHGVMKSQSFFKLPSALEKERMLKRSYSSAALSLLGLALCGSRAVSSFPPSLLATVAVLCAGICSSSLAFPFYQIPNMVSSHFFAGNQALCLSYLDGFAFFLAAPIWALSNRITNSMGWSASWGFLFLLFGVCGKVMMKAIQPILVKKPLEEA